MKNKKTNVILLGLALVVFLASGCADPSDIKKMHNEISRLTQSIQKQSVTIKNLTDQVRAKQKDLDAVKNELVNANNKLKTMTVPPVEVNK